MTEIVLKAVREFGIEMDQFHNDSTSITFHGGYENANGDKMRGKSTLNITHGHNKDHRPDLKQLVFDLTVTSDGAKFLYTIRVMTETGRMTQHILGLGIHSGN